MMTTARAAAATHHQSSGRPSAESTSVAAATGRSSGCGRGAAVDRRGAAVDRQRRSDAGVYEVCASLARSRVSRVRSPQRKRRVERVSRSRHTEANRRVPEKLLEKLLERGVTASQIYNIGLECLMLCSAKLPSEEEITNIENFSSSRDSDT